MLSCMAKRAYFCANLLDDECAERARRANSMLAARSCSFAMNTMARNSGVLPDHKTRRFAMLAESWTNNVGSDAKNKSRIRRSGPAPVSAAGDARTFPAPVFLQGASNCGMSRSIRSAHSIGLPRNKLFELGVTPPRGQRVRKSLVRADNFSLKNGTTAQNIATSAQFSIRLIRYN
jgi:hypothetical protein